LELERLGAEVEALRQERERAAATMRAHAIITGKVLRQGRVAVGAGGITLEELILQAGGTKPEARAEKVRLTRTLATGAMKVFTLDATQAPGIGFVVLPGDIVYVPEAIL